MSTTVNVVCYKSKVLKNNESPLMIRVCKDRKMKYQSLGISILPKYWDFKANKPTSKCPNKEYIERLIAEKVKVYTDKVIEFKSQEKEFTATSLMEKVNKPVKRKTVQEVFNQYIQELEPKEEKKAEVSAAPQGAIPEGTVLGDGHIKYGLARIDTRLLHGQVATAWTKTVGPNRIIVVSDNVAHDNLRKSMIEQAAPPGVKANVVPIDKMIQVAKDPRFGATKAMLLFETPQDALRAIKGGVDIKELNLGSMAHSQGKVVCTKAVSMGSDDVKTFDELLAMGIKIDVRKVPTDSPENFDEILKKAKTELK